MKDELFIGCNLMVFAFSKINEVTNLLSHNLNNSLIIITIGYTIWKWRSEYKKNKK